MTASLLSSNPLTDARAASDRLVAALREPADELGLTWEEHFVLLLLWNTDGRTEAWIADVLAVSPDRAAQTFRSLQEKALVERDREQGVAEVWLTNEGRRAQSLAGREAMCNRLQALESELAALRDMLQFALDVAARPRQFGQVRGHA